MFDAPSREESCVQRPRSNTPLQALVLLNDPTYVEAAQVFAEQVVRSGGKTVEERIRFAFQNTLNRDPAPREVEILSQVAKKHLAEFAEDKAAASEAIKTGNRVPSNDLDPVELAAWTSVTRILLNLNESITRY